MNKYEQKQQEKKERYEARAEAARDKSEELYERGSNALKQIPFGQPILVGHHSEGRDRNYRAKHRRTIDKSFEEGKKADYYEQKAKSVGMGGISSDDPDAVKKLEEKLEKRIEKQELMKKENKERRKAGKETIPGFVLSNNNANIGRLKKRIKQLRAKADMVVREDIKGDGWILKEDKEENRIMFVFDGKPDEGIRSELKSRGFRWSPRNTAWQRMLNVNGRYAAQAIVEILK